MKRILMVAVVMMMVAVMVGSVYAGTASQGVGVTGTVASVCKFTGAGTGLDFGTMDAVVDTAGKIATVATQPSFWCTKGYNYTITDDNGLWESGTTHQMRSNTDDGAGTYDFIQYTFTYTATGAGSGASVSLNPLIGGSISAGGFDNVKADTYSDTVTLTINY